LHLQTVDKVRATWGEKDPALGPDLAIFLRKTGQNFGEIADFSGFSGSFLRWLNYVNRLLSAC
jgi:hypothetical protein